VRDLRPRTGDRLLRLTGLLLLLDLERDRERDLDLERLDADDDEDLEERERELPELELPELLEPLRLLFAGELVASEGSLAGGLGSSRNRAGGESLALTISTSAIGFCSGILCLARRTSAIGLGSLGFGISFGGAGGGAGVSTGLLSGLGLDLDLAGDREGEELERRLFGFDCVGREELVLGSSAFDLRGGEGFLGSFTAFSRDPSSSLRLLTPSPSALFASLTGER